MKIVLVNPKLSGDAGGQKVLPLGLAYIAQAIVSAGHKLEIVDYSVGEIFNDSHYRYDAVCIGGLISSYKFIKKLAAKIKKRNPNIKIIVGNLVATSIPEIILKKTKVDIVVLGEGEITIVALLSALENNKQIKNIAGLAYRTSKNEIKFTQPRKEIKNLDTILFPARYLFNTRYYFSQSSSILEGIKNSSNFRVAQIHTSRGCPYACIFCCSHTFGKNIRFRSPENIFTEIKYLHEKYSINFIEFTDDLFVFDKKRLKKLCQLIINSGLKIKWGATGRVNTIDEASLNLMKKAGCEVLYYGIESGSQKILDSYKKGVTTDLAKKAILETKKAGIIPRCSFIIGGIGENKKTINESINFIKNNDLYPREFYFLTAYPATPLYIYAQQKNLIQTNLERQEKYIEKISEMKNRLLVNFSELSDQELIILKKKAEKEIKIHYFLKHPFFALKRIEKKLFSN